jgi:hypothetical protein
LRRGVHAQCNTGCAPTLDADRGGQGTTHPDTGRGGDRAIFGASINALHRIHAMTLRSFFTTAALALTCSGAWAGEPTIRVSVGGEIRPGVYGQVEFGNAPPPPVLYPQPVLIVQPAQRVVVVQPVYMHVPPGHAKRWSRYCHRYDACGRPVYFVKSSEYEPRYERDHDRGHGRGRGG